MGLVRGRYDAKASGFDPGGASLHVTMTPHRPESDAAPARLPDDSLAFMFELGFTPRVTPWALAAPELDARYYECWQGLRSHFDPAWQPESDAAAAASVDSAPVPAAG
jgi:homogentisate 1,2-dioxygenase